MRSTESGSEGIARRGLMAAATTMALCLGIAMISNGASADGPPPQPGAAQAFDSSAPSGGESRVAPMAPSVPQRVRIPALHLDAPLTGLGLDDEGRLTAPPEDDRNLAGWYEDGTTPGATGTAVVAGHVDTHEGPAVFYGLGALKKGNTVDVDRADGTTAVFTIDAIEVYASDDFPDKKVYGRAARPELRLITCGGGFSKAKQEYLGNVVVFAHLTGKKPRA
ncbi:class F sortase [Streptomyces sp. NBC_01465]|uniref:class F sortase n=1 Tax=Streptomyces sp. NBC_01465 TaxID=2903878 RepID=UPI002E32987D|nr:class F sortase [Streptomyces sp. NBC_01465]